MCQQIKSINAALGDCWFKMGMEARFILNTSPRSYHTHQNVFCCVVEDHLNCKMPWGILDTCEVFPLCECRCAAADQMGV